MFNGIEIIFQVVDIFCIVLPAINYLDRCAADDIVLPFVLKENMEIHSNISHKTNSTIAYTITCFLLAQNHPIR